MAQPMPRVTLSTALPWTQSRAVQLPDQLGEGLDQDTLLAGLQRLIACVKKLLKCWIVLGDGELPRSNELDLLASEANLELTDLLLDLQPFAVEARYQDGDFKLPASGARILAEIKLLADQLRQAIEAGANTNP